MAAAAHRGGATRPVASSIASIASWKTICCAGCSKPAWQASADAPRPMLAAAVDPAVAQQKRQQLLAFPTQIFCCRLARPHQIANRLVHRVRHPHRRQFAGPKQPRQRHRIAPVGLDPLAGLLRDQRWSHDSAVVTERLGPADTARTRSAPLRSRHAASVAAAQLADHRSTVAGELSISPRYRTSPSRPPSAIANRVLRLRRIKPDKSFAILRHGPPSVHEARLGQPEQPSYLYCTKGRAARLNDGHN